MKLELVLWETNICFNIGNVVLSSNWLLYFLYSVYWIGGFHKQWWCRNLFSLTILRLFDVGGERNVGRLVLFEYFDFSSFCAKLLGSESFAGEELSIV